MLRIKPRKNETFLVFSFSLFQKGLQNSPFQTGLVTSSPVKQHHDSISITCSL